MDYIVYFFATPLIDYHKLILEQATHESGYIRKMK